MNIIRSKSRLSTILASTALAASTATGLTLVATSTPAHAIPVFDSANYAQNLLTAARTLQQINQQIQSLQNEAQMIAQAARNLQSVDFPEMQRVQQTLAKIDRLMGQAQGIDFRVDNLDAQYRRMFPGGLRGNAAVTSARMQLDGAMAAFRQTMGVQSQVVENIADDARTLQELVQRSQGAEGALQATQTTNQLLALTAKQQFQIQQLMAVQFRAETMDATRRAAATAEAQAATRRFLGTGSAYPPR
jgi:P-type conjugative transfer protein TrbJ